MKIHMEYAADASVGLQIILEDVTVKDSILWLYDIGFRYHWSWKAGEKIVISCKDPISGYQKFMYIPSKHALYSWDWYRFELSKYI